MQGQDEDRKRIIVVIVGTMLLLVTIIAVSLINIIPKLGKVEVYVGYAPFIAEVTLNGEVVKNNEKNYLKKGDYELKVSLEGFKTLEKKVTIDDETKTIFGSIVANTEDGKKIANDKLKDYAVVQSLAGEALSKEGEKNLERWPIIRKLPLSNSLYKIGYVVEDDEIELTVSAYSAYVDTAVEKLLEIAYSANDGLEKYNIAFKDYNPDLAGKFVKNEESAPIEYIKRGFADVGEFNYIVGEQNDEYFYAKISTGLKEHYNLVHSRLVLKKNGNSWNLVSVISPILTVYNTEDVPEEIIRAANKL